VSIEALVLVGGVVVAGALLAVAVLAVRSDRALRLRLGVVFVAMALAPSLLTLVALWRELAPRSTLQAAHGVESSLEAALVLARQSLAARHAEAERLAASAARRAASGSAPLAAAPVEAVDGAAQLLVLFEPRAQRVVAVAGDWSETQARAFLERPSVRWPEAGFPAELVLAPDSSAVVVGSAPVPGSDPVRDVLVLLPVPPAVAAAIDGVVEGVQQSQRLGFLEELKLETAARLMAGLAALYLLVGLVLAAQLSRTLTRPVERLQQAFEAVAAGRLGHRVDLTGTHAGEMGRLLAGFNAMSRELEQSKAELVRTARLAAWSDVARRLAHEIKNPLTPITLSIHRLRRRSSGEDAVVHECLDTILEETSHLERLANEFSSFARLPKPDLQVVDPAAVLQQVLDLHAAHAGLRLAADLGGMPAVLADRDQLRQVFTNLLKNAVEAMPAGGTVEVRWERHAGTLHVTVLDSGSGFATVALEHLFDPTYTTKPGGSGLGLAIVRRILDDHGGSIDAGNRAEGGAWVRVGLRLADRAVSGLREA
jgi:nitrogen fixation/metabolism regulation signal transduction histidine kinase